VRIARGFHVIEKSVSSIQQHLVSLILLHLSFSLSSWVRERKWEEDLEKISLSFEDHHRFHSGHTKVSNFGEERIHIKHKIFEIVIDQLLNSGSEGDLQPMGGIDPNGHPLEVCDWAMFYRLRVTQIAP
jgi:hypothetical protein